MPDTYTIKRGATRPALRYSAGVDLTGATARFVMADRPGAVPVVNASAEVAGEDLIYRWAATDTLTARAYYAEFRVTFPGGAVQVFPSDAYLAVEIMADLGGTAAEPIEPGATTGSGSATEGADTATGTGTAPITGIGAAVEGADTATGAGSVANVAPTVTTQPIITGATTVGSVLTATVGAASGTPAPASTVQWLRDGAPISGATAATYTLVAADEGKAISASVTWTNSAGSATGTSNAITGQAAPVTATAPAQVTGLTYAAPNLTWTVPADGGSPITRYDVEIVAAAASFTGTPTGTSTTTSLDVSAQPAGDWQARVRAVNAVGAGAWSNAAAFAVKAVVSITALPTTGPQPVAAWGFQRLNPSYTGPLFRVVRPSDGATREIVQAADGTVDLAGYEAWAGTQNVGVDTVYDQYGSNHLTQTTLVNRPLFMADDVVDGKYGATFTSAKNLVVPTSLTGGGQTTTTVDVAYAISADAGGGYAMLGQAYNNDGANSLLLGNGRGTSGRITVLNKSFISPGFYALNHLQVVVVAQGSTKQAIHVNDKVGEVAASSAGTWSGGYIGKGASNYQFAGQFFARAIYPVTLTPEEIAPIKAAVYGMYGINPNPVAKIVMPGNSIVQGASALRSIHNMQKQARPLFSASSEIVNGGVYGISAADAYKERSYYFSQINASRQRNFFLIPEPTNDINSLTEANVVGAASLIWANTTKLYIEGAIAAGYAPADVIVPTTLARNWSGQAIPQKEAERLAYNQLVRDNAASMGYTVMDWAAIPAMQSANGGNYTDGIHPNSTTWKQGLEVTGNGYGYLAKSLINVINARLAA